VDGLPTLLVAAVLQVVEAVVVIHQVKKLEAVRWKDARSLTNRTTVAYASLRTQITAAFNALLVVATTL